MFTSYLLKILSAVPQIPLAHKLGLTFKECLFEEMSLIPVQIYMHDKHGQNLRKASRALELWQECRRPMPFIPPMKNHALRSVLSFTYCQSLFAPVRSHREQQDKHLYYMNKRLNWMLSSKTGGSNRRQIHHGITPPTGMSVHLWACVCAQANTPLST